MHIRKRNREKPKRIDWAKDGVKERLCEAQNHRCCYCGKQLTREGAREDYPTVEHVTPLFAGGADSRDNIVIACQGCNESAAIAALRAFRQRRREFFKALAKSQERA